MILQDWFQGHKNADGRLVSTMAVDTDRKTTGIPENLEILRFETILRHQGLDNRYGNLSILRIKSHFRGCFETKIVEILI